MNAIRPPAVAGLFYPAEPARLARQVRSLLSTVAPPTVGPLPKALIVPHAGYVYSGPVAASAYTQLASRRGLIRRVVLLGPVHRVPVKGLALPRAEAFATPLGRIELDDAAIAAISDLPQVIFSDAAHAQEHSLEVHLPFLQQVLGEFRLLPLAVGDATAAEVAQVLERVWGGEETLILISSDLSHFLPYAQARVIDGQSVRQIVALHPDLTHEQACGATPINGLLAQAARHGMTAELLDLRNSGDTAGDKSRVVGYAAIAFYQPRPPAQTEEQRGATLLKIAREAISRHLGGPALTGVEAALTEQPWLQEPGASFVTLTQEGRLRGCIGSLQAHRSLLRDVRANAVAAAVHDPRFPPLTLAELAGTRIEVSLLSPAEDMCFSSEQDALAQLRPGIDGVLLEHGAARGTFLPQVWQSLPKPADFMAQLKLKAGLLADFWDADIRLSRYQIRKWEEPEHA